MHHRVEIVYVLMVTVKVHPVVCVGAGLHGLNAQSRINSRLGVVREECVMATTVVPVVRGNGLNVWIQRKLESVLERGIA
jgi:hypothetical protein